MDQGESQRLSRWLREKWDHGPCPVCGVDEWLPQGKVGELPNLGTLETWGGLADNGRVPVLLVTCQNCGYLVTVNALVAGIRIPGEGGIRLPGDDDE